MTARLENKVALVTGAASGIGEATARRFAEEDAHVFVADLNAAALHCAAQDYSIRVNSVHPGFITTPMVEEGISGYLVEYGDSARLAQQILTILENPDQQIKMGIAAKKEGEKRFKLSSISQKTHDLYCQLSGS